MLDFPAFFFTIKFDEFFAETVGGCLGTLTKCLTELVFSGPSLSWVSGYRNNGFEILRGPKTFNLGFEFP